MNKWIVMVLLVGSGICDFKWKKIPTWLLLSGICAGVVFEIVNIFAFERGNVWSIIVDLLPGICAIGMAWVWRDRVGLGDGLVLMMLGLFLGVEQTILVAVVSLLLTSLFGLVLLVLKKATLQTALPFIPFLAVGAMIVFWGNNYT